MARIHLFGHMSENTAKVGDRVYAYKTKLGTIGDGNSKTSSNQMYAHLHHEISDNLTYQTMLRYVIRKGRSYVKKNYINPRQSTNYDKMFGRRMDVGIKGYDFLDQISGASNSFHPGLDINGSNTYGNQDFGLSFTSPVDGIVVHSRATWGRGGGWGNTMAIEEIPITCEEELKLYKEKFGQI